MNLTIPSSLFRASIRGFIFSLLFLCLDTLASGQITGGNLSGSVMNNTNLFLRDSSIGADNTPQYDKQLIGSETWLNLTYNTNTVEAGMRFDLFQNSNLLDPQSSFSDAGIGRWYVKYHYNKLQVSGGYLYDQIGSGIIFRAYEDRTQLIDNALYGVRAQYEMAPDWTIKAFSGKQKHLFDHYKTDIRGANIEGFLNFDSLGGLSLAPGIGFVNTTYDNKTMNDVVDVLTSYRPDERVIPQYNSYITSLYNNLSFGPLTWYAEWAHRSANVLYDPFAKRTLISGDQIEGRIVKRAGDVLYSSLSYAIHGFGISVDYKRTTNFEYRAHPLLPGNEGFIGFIPPMGRINTYRLTARYSPATQYIGEQAVQVDARYKLNRRWSFNINASNITNQNNDLLYRELYTEFTYKKRRKWQILGGVQFMDYNFAIYRGKPGYENVKSIVPYTEVLYKFSRSKSLRVEAQYMFTRQDEGQWAYTLFEVGLAPHWLFEASLMYNVVSFAPKAQLNETLQHHLEEKGRVLYPTLGAVYTHGSNRFSLRYVKQVAGVVCSGGICRYEPAFSGVRFNLTSTF